MKMFNHRTNSTSVRKMLVAFTIMLVLGALVPGALAAGKKKPVSDGRPAKPSSVKIHIDDINKLVWPNPPAIARVRYVDQLTGEKVDTEALTGKQKKPKQSWMDRMAGTDPEKGPAVPVPFQLIRTYGVAVDSKGKIYAADQGVGAVFVFNPEDKSKVEMIGNGKEAHFGLITGLAIDDSDKVFVGDAKLHQVVVINTKHEQEAVFGTDALVAPAGMAIDPENRFLYVVDTQRDQVAVFDADTYKLLRYIGITGKKHRLTDPGTFSLPVGVAVDKDRNVYVTDTLNCRVEVFDAEGKFIREFGKIGDGPAAFERPKGIAIDSDGHVWVIDAGQSKIKVFDSEGNLMICFSEAGEYPSQLADPWGLAIDKKNRVITSEQFPGRVQIFRYVTDAEAEAERKKREANATPSAPSTPPAAKAETTTAPAGKTESATK